MQGLDQARKVFLEDAPNLFHGDVEIIVDHDVAEASDFLPRYIKIFQ